MTSEAREAADVECQDHYERTMSDWLAVEAIVKQRDKEIMAANLVKLSQESQGKEIMAANLVKLSQEIQHHN